MLLYCSIPFCNDAKRRLASRKHKAELGEVADFSQFPGTHNLRVILGLYSLYETIHNWGTKTASCVPTFFRVVASDVDGSVEGEK